MIYKKKTKLAFDKTLLSLAFADLLSSLFWGVFLLNGYYHLFMITMIGSFFSITSSLLHAVFIATERFFAVFFPIKFRIYFTWKYCAVCLLIVWLISLSLSCVVSAFSNLSAMSYIIFPSGGLLVVFYSMICYRVHLQRRSAVVMSTGSHLQDDSTSRILVYSVLITAVFLLCTMPFAVLAHGTALKNCYAFIMISLNPVFDAVTYFAFNYSKKHGCCRYCHRMTDSCQARIVVTLQATSVANSEQPQIRDSQL